MFHTKSQNRDGYISLLNRLSKILWSPRRRKWWARPWLWCLHMLHPWLLHCLLHCLWSSRASSYPPRSLLVQEWCKAQWKSLVHCDKPCPQWPSWSDWFSYSGELALGNIWMKVDKCKVIIFYQILHMDAGDTLELRMTSGDYINQITLNIELIGSGLY